MTAVIRASRTIASPSRLAPRIVRTIVTATPAHVAVTTSIGKTKGVDGPEVSSYSNSKHLKVPSGLTIEQVTRTGNF